MSTGSAVVTGTGTNEDVLDTVTDADVEKLIDSLFDSSDL